MPSNPNTPGSNRPTAGTGSHSGTATTGGAASGSTSTSVKDQAASKAREAGAQVKEQAQEKLDQAKTQAMSRLRDGKSRVAGQVGTVAHAFRSAGSELRGEDQARLAEFTETAAERVERMGRYIEEHSVGEMLDDVERLARRAPSLFLGGAFAMGLLGARFLKTSERRRQHEHTGFGDGDSYGAGARTLPRPGEVSAGSYGDSYAPASSQPASAGLASPPGTGGADA